MRGPWTSLTTSRSCKYPTTFFLGIKVLLTLTAYNSTTVPPRPKVTHFRTMKSYFASQMQPSTYCSSDWKFPKSPLAPTDVGTRFGDATWLLPVFGCSYIIAGLTVDQTDAFKATLAAFWHVAVFCAWIVYVKLKFILYVDFVNVADQDNVDC